MNNCSSSCHLPLILIWKENTRPLISLNIDQEQTLNDNNIVTSFSSSRFDRTLTDCMLSKNSRNTVKLNEIFSTHSPPAKFPFNHYTPSTSVSDPEVKLIHSDNYNWQFNRSREVQHRHRVYLREKKSFQCKLILCLFNSFDSNI